MSNCAQTVTERYRGSDDETDQEQAPSVPVILDDSNVDAIIGDVDSRPHTAQSAPEIGSKSSTIADKPSANPAQDMDTGDVTLVRSQPIPSYNDSAGYPQGGAAKTPSRHAQSLSATSPTASHRPGTSLNTNIPSVSVVSSTPVSPTAPESFGPLQEDRLPPAGRNTPVNDRDRRQSRRRSVMDNPRISGFLNSFLHIHREREPQTAPPSPQSPAYMYGHSSSPRAPNTDPVSPPPAPPTVSRPPTPPPPSLPPPTLSELGLTLMQLSEPLPPPFPSSGVFLAPSYILLCNQHGLDVMPLPQPGQQVQAPIKPYALIRRVPFKNCVVMEERGVLVAIAGRRDGVRVYALEEVRRAVEWRIDVEVRKEMDRLRREEMKRLAAPPPISITFHQAKAGEVPKSAPPADAKGRTLKGRLTKSPSMDSIPAGACTPPGTAATANPSASMTRGSRKSSLRKKPPKAHKESRNRDSIFPSSRPPLPPPPPAPPIPPASPAQYTSPAHRLVPRTSVANFNIHRHATRRAMSAREAMAAPVPQPEPDVVAMDVNEDGVPIPITGERVPLRREDIKSEWMDGGDHSDEEALVAAGPSGSAALDERTSAAVRASLSRANSGLTSEAGGINSVGVPIMSSSGTGGTAGIVRQRRPSNLNLSPVAVRPGEGEGDDDDMPSPAPTLLTLRQALQATAGRASSVGAPNTNMMTSDDHDEPNTPTGEVISFAEWLLESRLPDAPPLGMGIGSGRVVRRRGASVGSTGDVPPTPPSASTVAGATLVTRYPLSRGYDLYGATGNGGADTGLEAEGPESGADEGVVCHGASDTENVSGTGRTRRSSNRRQGPASHGGSVRVAGNRRNRRWSVLDGILHPGSGSNVNATSPFAPAQSPPTLPNHSTSALQRIGSSASQPQITQLRARPSFRRHRSTRSQGALSPESHPLPSQSAVNGVSVSESEAGHGEPSIAGLPSGTQGISTSGPPSSRPHHSRLSRFFHLRSSKTRSPGSIHEGGVLHVPDSSPGGTGALAQEYERRGALAMSALAPAAPAPKLEYIKLPGTKGAVMVKAVETARKSFLAILCGEAGEKVELFAGTYRTALGLSRTFILPDSPKTLELQLQGDDLVEVFLVFAQNVFGLEPATVRVREVRIGRAERRAARRRAARSAAANATSEDLGDVNVNVVIGTGAPVPPSALETLGEQDDYFDGDGVGSSRPLEPSDNPDSAPTAPNITGTSSSDNLPPLGPPTAPHPDEVVAAQLAAMGPYTTFQQLSFAPLFPLETLAEECMIPPTYKSLVEYKAIYEPEGTPASNEDTDEEPPLPPPAAIPPVDVLWFYRDPKAVIQGPWKASLMQSWFKDGFLPPDLPVRRETETEYILLRDLRRQSIDPGSPFRPPPPGLRLPDHVRQYNKPETVRPDGVNPLLEPISLLVQPKHFGPPALFFSSRGGHSTSIVDARGRSVLKGRFNWTLDDQVSQNQILSPTRLGDVKHLEAFEVDKIARAVVVAFRQGGIEAVNVGDAVTSPGDGCRTVYPYFDPPPNTVNRRRTFVWRVGDDVEAGSGGKKSKGRDLSGEMDGSRNGSVVDTLADTITVSVLGGHHHFGRKAPMGRGAGGDPLEDDREPGLEDLLVIGRDKDKVYFCNRRAGTFRLMCLAVE